MGARQQADDVPQQGWVAIVANPYSGSGKNRRRVTDLARALERRGIRADLAWGPSMRAELMHDDERSRGCRCVVAAGGDGTVADVINQRTDIPIALLPLGTENLFAKEFGFTHDTEALADSIARGRCRTIDLARAGDHLFSLMLTAGLDAHVVALLAEWRAQSTGLRRVRRLSYAAPILKAIRSYRFPRIELDADGQRVTGVHALVFNLRGYALQMPFAPEARADDAVLDWVVFERPGVLPAVKCYWDVFRKSHLQRRGVRHGRAKRIRIVGHGPVPMQVDGDAFGTTPVDIEVVPQALRVIVHIHDAYAKRYGPDTQV